LRVFLGDSSAALRSARNEEEEELVKGRSKERKKVKDGKAPGDGDGGPVGVSPDP
jgi:hypothetical protein